MKLFNILKILVLFGSSFSVLAFDYKTEVIKETLSNVTYITDGFIEPIKESRISAQVIGQITDVFIKDADLVKKGDVLVKIYSKGAEQEAQFSLAQYEIAKTQLSVAMNDLERQNTLYMQKNISKAALESYEAILKEAKANMDNAKSQVEATQTKIGFFTITAPYDGVIKNVAIEVGDMVIPGKELVKLYDLKKMRILSSISQSKMFAISNEFPIRVELNSLPKLDRFINIDDYQIIPIVDPNSQTAHIRLNLPENKYFTPGIFARVYIPLKDKQLKIVIPSSSVITRAEQAVVYILTPKGAILRQVKLGKEQDSKVEILAGVRIGEELILDPLSINQVNRVNHE